ncbi:hypothetical protein BD779DRAFT_450227 [Infundibulicybe gibba]|nr:hypothetical protein BD779DRAFT_450227 [Infundibulicybe gibba]
MQHYSMEMSLKVAAHPEPRPTHRDVLKAVSTISEYIDEWNDPISRKMEAMLGSFSKQMRLRETRRMKDTTLTDFFRRV